MRKKLIDKTTISNLRVNTAKIVLTVLLSSTAFKMNSIDSLANTNDTVISLEKETIYISEIVYNSQNFDDLEVITLAESDEALIRKLEYIYKYGYDAGTDTVINTSFNVTTGNKTYENLSSDDFRLFQAVVAAESNKTLHDAMGVTSIILNRPIDERWVNSANNLGLDGENPIDQIKHPGQFSVYLDGKYEYYLDEDNVPEDVKIACRLAWYHGVRITDCTSFLGNAATDCDGIQVVEGGNRYFNRLVKLEKDMTIVDRITEPINKVNDNVKKKIKVVE